MVNKFMKDEKWSEAKDSFEKALEIKPNERIPKDKIEEIDNILKNIVLRGEYNELVDQGDKLFDSEEYDKAIEKYEEALEIFAKEKYPRDQINEAKRIQNELANAAKAAEELEKEYNDLIKFAQKNFKDKEYESALEKFEEASRLKPEEELPQRKIEEINQILADLAAMEAKQAEEDAANAEANKIEEEYQAFIEKGNDFFKDKELESARREFEGALGVKPGDKYAQNKIDKIDEMLADLAEEASKKQDEDNARAEQEAIDKQYNDLITEADAFFDAESYEKALEKYGDAIEVKDEKYPNSRIKQINSILEDLQKQEDDDALAELERKRQEEEEARLAEEQRLADELAEKERLLKEKKDENDRDDSDVDDKSGRQYSTIDGGSDDKVVKYYRDAKKSEDLAKYDAIQDEKDNNDKLHGDLNSMSNLKRIDNMEEVEERQDGLEAMALNGEDNRMESLLNLENQEKENNDNLNKYEKDADKRRARNENDVEEDKSRQDNLVLNDAFREQKVEDNSDWKDKVDNNTRTYESKGDAGRVDNMFEIEEKIEKSEVINEEGERKRLENVAEAEQKQIKQDQYHTDLSDASQVRRENNFMEVEEKQEKSEGLSQSYEVKLLENQSDVDKKKNSQDAYLKGKELDADLRRLDAMEGIDDKYKGEEKDPEDYNLGEGESDVRYGVSETSREQGNKTIIERTVREGNKVDIYRKVISKTGIYYFKNGNSCTEQIWELETVRVFD